MLEPHQRAALIPNDPGVSWHHFLRSRFASAPPAVAGRTSLAVVVQSLEQRSPFHAEWRGLVELASGSSLPVVSEFHGELNLETREFSLQQSQPERHYSGQISENGRVMVLQQSGQSKAVHLVHDETLAELV